jgi:hypothetical protein
VVLRLPRTGLLAPSSFRKLRDPGGTQLERLLSGLNTGILEQTGENPCSTIAHIVEVAMALSSHSHCERNGSDCGRVVGNSETLQRRAFGMWSNRLPTSPQRLSNTLRPD